MSKSRRLMGLMSRTHGATSGGKTTPTYRSWRMMKDRCNNPNSNNFQRYGGKGISVCERWNDFANFLADMAERPAGMTLDRIDYNGNYEPSNCRWATDAEQDLNKTVGDKTFWPPSAQKSWEADQQSAKKLVEIRELVGPEAAMFVRLCLGQSKVSDIDPKTKAKVQQLIREWISLDEKYASHYAEFAQDRTSWLATRRESQQSDSTDVSLLDDED